VEIRVRKAWQWMQRKANEEKDDSAKNEPLERGDFLAMLLAAMGTIFLPVVLILLVFCGLIYWLFVLI